MTCIKIPTYTPNKTKPWGYPLPGSFLDVMNECRENVCNIVTVRGQHQRDTNSTRASRELAQPSKMYKFQVLPLITHDAKRRCKP